MNNRPILIAIAILLLLAGCKEPARHKSIDNKTYKFNSQYKLEQGRKISFLLDSLSNPNIDNVELFKTDSVEYFTFLNKQFNAIYFYDFKTSKFKFKIDIHTSGKESVGNLVNSYHIKSLDSIFIISRYRFSIIDRRAHILFTRSFLYDRPEPFTALPEVFCYSPLIVRGDSLYFNSVPDKKADNLSSFDGKQCMIAYSMKTNEFRYMYTYPEVYREGIFGPNYMITYHTYNPNTARVIFSFPADNDIYVSNGEELIPHYAGSKFLGPVNAMTTVDDDNFELYNKFFLQNPSYGPIYYDKFRDVYYRFALLPVSEEDYKAKRWWKKKSVVILDKNLKKIGETRVPDIVSFYSCFVTEDGLYAGTDDGNDRISMTLFKLTSTNNDEHETARNNRNYTTPSIVR